MSTRAGGEAEAIGEAAAGERKPASRVLPAPIFRLEASQKQNSCYHKNSV
jgi:hypothetical protein